MLLQPLSVLAALLPVVAANASWPHIKGEHRDLARTRPAPPRSGEQTPLRPPIRYQKRLRLTSRRSTVTRFNYAALPAPLPVYGFHLGAAPLLASFTPYYPRQSPY